MYAGVNGASGRVVDSARGERCEMGVNAEKKLNVVTVLQLIVALLFGFSVWTTRSAYESYITRLEKVEAGAVAAQLAREGDIRPRLMLTEQKLEAQQKQLDKMDGKLDLLLEKMSGR